MSFGAGVAVGFAMGKKMFEGGGGGSDEWTFPSHWLDIPDPEPNQVIMYVEAEAGDVAPIISLFNSTIDSFKGGTIDYGDDGYTYEYPAGYGYNVYHIYQTAGQYIITITAADNVVVFSAGGANVAFMAGHIVEGNYPSAGGQYTCVKAAKVGRDINKQSSLNLFSSTHFQNLVYLEFMGGINNNSFGSLRSLKKIKIGLPPESLSNYAFINCMALEQIDGLQNLKIIPTGLFSGCYALKKVDMPSAESENGAAFKTNCCSLRSVNAPKLTAIAADEFSSCYSLQSLTLAEGCNLNGNKFSNCPQLYPKPQ